MVSFCSFVKGESITFGFHYQNLRHNKGVFELFVIFLKGNPPTHNFLFWMMVRDCSLSRRDSLGLGIENLSYIFNFCASMHNIWTQEIQKWCIEIQKLCMYLINMHHIWKIRHPICSRLLLKHKKLSTV